MTSCDCTHLTHFAVLMDVRGHDLNEIDQTLLTLLTYVGCIISIICLLLTFFAYLIFSRNGGDRVFIHENLCLSLAIAEITFLAGITRTEDSLQCGIIAVALMYMFLSALTWMLLEGYHIHRMLTEVFPSDPRRFTYLLVGYIPQQSSHLWPTCTILMDLELPIIAGLVLKTTSFGSLRVRLASSSVPTVLCSLRLCAQFISTQVEDIFHVVTMLILEDRFVTGSKDHWRWRVC